MKKYKKGDIVIAPFPYSNGKGSKERPCLVLRHNNELNDIMLAMISGTDRKGVSRISIKYDSEENASMNLRLEKSVIHLDVVQTVKTVCIKEKIGECPASVVKKIDYRRSKM